jgi:hypothetical protein
MICVALGTETSMIGFELYLPKLGEPAELSRSLHKRSAFLVGLLSIYGVPCTANPLSVHSRPLSWYEFQIKRSHRVQRELKGALLTRLEG